MRLEALAACALLALATAAQEQPTGEIKPLLESASTAHMKGDYEASRQSLLQAWELAQQRPSADPIRYDVLKRLVSVRSTVGDYADADNFLQMAINWRELTNGQNDPKIADDLLVSVSLCRGMKTFDRAMFILQRVMTLHRLAFGPDTTPIADDFSRMAQIHMDQKNLLGAENALRQAIAIRTTVAGPLDASLVPDLDRLAGLMIAVRAYDKAEALFRQAMVIRETLLGKEDADLIATVDGLAYAVFGQKRYDDADPLYQRLIALWTKSVGADHPMVAMALDKVAVFYADQKKFDQAREVQNRAIAIRARFLATGLSLAATAETAQQHKEEALAHYKRALLVLDPPHEIYDETRSIIEEIVKGLEPTPAAAKPAPKKSLSKKK
jgi:tetratricopeptide (TPR) repeat protein